MKNKFLYNLISLNPVIYCWVFLFTVFFSEILFSQSIESEFEINSIEVIHNDIFLDSDLQKIFFSKETPNFFSKYFYQIFGEKIGNPPSYFDYNIFSSDIEKIKNFYIDNGYLDVEIDTNLFFDENKSFVDIKIKINSNQEFFLDSINYFGLEKIDESLSKKIFSTSIIHNGDIYNASHIANEIDRILDTLKNFGYPNCEFLNNNSSIHRYTSTNIVSVSLYFDIGKKYVFGNLYYEITSPTIDTIEYEVLEKQIKLKQNDLYSENKKKTSEQNLNKLGVFEFARIDPISIDDTIVFFIPMKIYGVLLPKYSIMPEINYSDINNAFNIGIGTTFIDRNFFGNAKNFRSQISVDMQSIQLWNFKNLSFKNLLNDSTVIGKVDLSFSLTQQYIFQKSLSLSSTFLLRLDKQKDYLQNIERGKLSIVNQFTEFTYGFFDWALERSDVEILPESKRKIEEIDFKEETKPQFNSIFSFTLQKDKTDNLFFPSNGFLNSITIDESGSFSSLLKNIQPNLPFTQFLNFSFTGKYYFKINTSSIFASKLKIGIQSKYGDDKKNDEKKIPLNRRYFAGGSGSIRAWNPRDLGADFNSKNFGGNFLFEINIENRINPFKNFQNIKSFEISKLGFVIFFDVGNMWSELQRFRFDDIAVAIGSGIRYDTFIGSLRFDFGIKGYNPYTKENIFRKKFFNETLNDFAIHFGIGHAF